MEALTPLLNVEDPDRSLSFYVGVLGFSLEADFEHEGQRVWARLAHGPIQLMINRSPGRIARGARSDARSYDDVVLCARVEDAAAAHATLAEAGCEPGALRSEDYGMLEFTVRDPDGCELAFQQPVEPPIG